MDDQQPELYQATVAIPGLLGFLPEDQRSVLAAMAGLDIGAPRNLAEVAEVLKEEPETVFFLASLAIRGLHRELITVDPLALRLVTSCLTENVAADLADPGVLSLQRLVPAVRAGSFPAAMQFYVTNVWSGGRPDTEHNAGVRIMTPDGEMLAYATTVIPAPGLGSNHAQVLDFTGHVWPEPGLYTLEVWLDGAPLGAYPLPVYEMVEPEPVSEAEPVIEEVNRAEG